MFIVYILLYIIKALEEGKHEISLYEKLEAIYDLNSKTGV